MGCPGLGREKGGLSRGRGDSPRGLSRGRGCSLRSALVPLLCQEHISQALSHFLTYRSTANRWQEETSPCFSPPSLSVPGPCDPEDLLDGVIFGAKYLGSTQLVSERNPPTSVRMAQAQEAVDRIKVQGGARPDLLRVLGSILLQGRDPAVTSLSCFALQAPEGESQPMTEVDLFVSTQRIKVLTADTQVSRDCACVALRLLGPSCRLWDLLCLL